MLCQHMFCYSWHVLAAQREHCLGMEASKQWQEGSMPTELKVAQFEKCSMQKHAQGCTVACSQHCGEASLSCQLAGAKEAQALICCKAQGGGAWSIGGPGQVLSDVPRGPKV